MRTTHTYVIMELSKPAFEEIERNMRAAGYEHAIHEGDSRSIVIDMHGIAVAAKETDGQA